MAKVSTQVILIQTPLVLAFLMQAPPTEASQRQVSQIQAPFVPTPSVPAPSVPVIYISKPLISPGQVLSRQAPPMQTTTTQAPLI